MLSVEVNHITKVYGDRAVVNDVSFTVNPEKSSDLSDLTERAKPRPSE